VKNVQILCIHGKMKHKRNKVFTAFHKLQRWVGQLCLRLPGAPTRVSAGAQHLLCGDSQGHCPWGAGVTCLVIGLA
jgi:hypothetical protein